MRDNGKKGMAVKFKQTVLNAINVFEKPYHNRPVRRGGTLRGVGGQGFVFLRVCHGKIVLRGGGTHRIGITVQQHIKGLVSLYSNIKKEFTCPAGACNKPKKQ